MQFSTLKTIGVGQKLVLLFTIGFVFLLLVVALSSLLLERIDKSKRILTDSSIPTLVQVNAMSVHAHDLIQTTFRMSDAKTIQDLQISKREASKAIEHLNAQLDHLRNKQSLFEYKKNIEDVLIEFELNLNNEYRIIEEKILITNNYKKILAQMRNAVESIANYIKIKKIHVNAEFSEKIIELKKQTNIDAHANEILRNVDIISELVSRIADIEKDLRSVEQSTTDENVLIIQQEFDHSLRVLTRAIANDKELGLKNNMGQHVLTLIKYGQDSPDIFDNKLRILYRSRDIAGIHNENFKLIERLNNSVNALSEFVRNSTEISSLELNQVIKKSKYAFYIVALLSIFIFVFVILKFILTDIVKRLAKLSEATTKLSNDDLNFTIDTSGKDEFSQFAHALKSVKRGIKERKQLNKDLKRQSELLKRSNEDLSLFANIASHDLQEPLRAISGYSQLLSKRYKDVIDKDVNKYIDYIVSGCSRMEALIEGLLRFSRVDTQSSTFESIWIEEILREIKKDFSVKISETFALVSWGEMPHVYADPVQIRTVFQNFVSNSLKYNQSKPPKIRIKAEQVDNFWKFYVTDNGIGIDDINHEKVFEVFKRLHSRNQYPGTGIGLSLCKKIIERHGGKITLKSKLNEGTTFIFTLPVDDRYRIDNATKAAA